MTSLLPRANFDSNLKYHYSYYHPSIYIREDTHEITQINYNQYSPFMARFIPMQRHLRSVCMNHDIFMEEYAYYLNTESITIKYDIGT